ncbi:nuclear exosome regulator NRDE2 isoform X2 [Halyomorpha halys]|uniref:nuclear exosome regulator NRDE2 isoform X2 n=1 Tax=Halyomorpha halys TaxID=286706 RepID=UPI0034D1D2AF
MSLFPAFDSNNSLKNESVPEKEAGPSWLNNSSFVPPEIKSTVASSSLDENSDEEESEKKRSKSHSKKSKKKKHRSKKNIEGGSSDSALLFYEDSKALKRNSGYSVPQVKLTKATISYNVEKKKKKRKKDKSRYFQKKLDEENEVRNSLINPEPMDIQEFLKRTESFNQTLRNEPHNVNIWLDYVKLQDSGIGSVRGRGEKKLSILDRALLINPDADELLHEKMSITESIYPLDKVATEARALVTKYPQNMIGWMWVINSLQFNLSKMAAPGVLINYEKALEGINKAHHDSNNFMDILLQCGLFLRQSGLWEQLWVLLELYLELNLTTAGSEAFKEIVHLPKDEIQRLEDSVITSGLPLGSLWLRIERLREGIYFFPVEESSDPQRMVFREDLAQLLFPVTKSCETRIIMNTLLLLKVPPLPLTDAFYRFTKLDKISWSLDCVEIILSAKCNEDYLDIVLELLYGPQYLVTGLGQNQFFDFVNSIFEKCIHYSSDNKICFLVWQIRWWRWVYLVRRVKDDESNDDFVKHLLSRAKKLLKQHRDCIPLYIEYALLEYEVGNLSACLKVLEMTMSLRSPPLIAGTLEKRDLCTLYKEYILLLIKEGIILNKEKILVAFIALAFGEPMKNIAFRDDLLTKSSEKFTHITTEILHDIKNAEVGLSEIIFPEFAVSWLTLHAWFSFIHEGIQRSTNIIENAIQQLEKLKNGNGNLIDVMLEQLYECLVNITLLYCKENAGHFSILHDILLRAVQHYPNNGLFYNAINKCEVVGIKWQKMTSVILSSGSPLASAFAYFITHTRLIKEQFNKGNVGIRLQNLLEKLRSSYERCPLFWRLFLQASSLKDTEDIKQIFYRSVEKCPWVKFLYYEAAKILPEDLPEIQDLLVEKELRLHTTPEELEILREGS